MYYRVSLRPDIARLDRVRTFEIDAPPESNLLVLARRLLAELPFGLPELYTHGTAFVRDMPVPAKFWHRVRPKPGYEVAFTVVPADDEVVSFAASAAVLVAQVGAQFLLPGFGGAVVGALIGLGGSLLVNEIVGSPRSPKITASKETQDDPVGITGNALAPFDPISCVVGKIRMSPQHFIQPFVVRNYNQPTAYAIMGLSGEYDISDVLVNGAPIDDYQQIDYDLHAGPGPVDHPLSIVTTTVIQEKYDRQLQKANLATVDGDLQFYKRAWEAQDTSLNYLDYNQPSLFRTPDSWDRMVIDLKFPTGLARTDSNGNNAVITFRMRFKHDDETAYRNMPEPLMKAKAKSVIYSRIRFLREDDPGGLTAPNNNDIWKEAYSNHANMDRVADSYFGTSVAATHCDVSGSDQLDIYLEKDEFPDGKYTFEMMCSQVGYASRMVYSTYRYNPGTTVDFRGYSFLGTNEYLSLENQANVSGDPVIEYISYEWDDEPVALSDGGFTYIELAASGVVVESISWIAQRRCQYRWTGSEWINEPQVSSNPATNFLDVLLSSDNARPVPIALIDLDALGAWHDYCETNKLEVNAVVTGMTIDDVLDLICRAGNGLLSRSQLWSVVIDNDRSGETLTQVFSPRVIRGYAFERVFREAFPHALRVSYVDEDDDYQERTTIVYADGYSASTATLIEAIDYRGITDKSQAENRALQDLRRRTYRSDVHRFETNYRNLILKRGSLIGLHTDAIDIAGFGMVTKVFRQVIGGVTKITGVELDDVRALPTGDIFELADLFAVDDIFSISAGVALGLLDNTVTTAAVDEFGNSKILTFSTPLTDTDELAPGCQCTGFLVGSEYRELIVMDIQRADDFNAAILAVPAAPEIFA